ncbi:MAG: hypothetical protein AABM41_06155 [Chloroflexota bacterium]
MKRTVTLASLLLLAACAPSASVTPSPSPLPTLEESIAGIPSPAACDPGTVCDGPLAAGDYVSDTTGAHIEFTLDDHDWSGLVDIQDVGFALFLADVGGNHAVSVVSYSGEIFTDACSSEATSTIGTTPADFMTFLAARTGVTASAPVEVEVGGRPALQVDLTTEMDAACEATGGGRIWLWVLPVVGDFHFNDAETARVIAVDGGSATVIIVIEAFPDVEYDHLLDHATEVVESMVIEPL